MTLTCTSTTTATGPVPANPPTYSDLLQELAARSTTSSIDKEVHPEDKYLTIKFNPSRRPHLPPVPPALTTDQSEPSLDPTTSSSATELGGTPLNRPESRPDLNHIPGAPEFRDAISQFEKAHLDLQGHAHAIFHITEYLGDLRTKIFRIQEFWMENGMGDIAHDVLPILDVTEKAVPQFGFPQAPSLVTPVM